MLKPEDIEETIQEAARQHAEEMGVLRRALEISRRVKQGAVNQPEVETAQRTPILVKRPVQRNGKKKGLTETVREVYQEYSQRFSMRSIVANMATMHPEVLKSTSNYTAAISGVLLRDSKAGLIELVERGVASDPSYYRNKTPRHDQQHFSTAGHNQRQTDLPVVNGTGEGAET